MATIRMDNGEYWRACGGPKQAQGRVPGAVRVTETGRRRLGPWDCGRGVGLVVNGAGVSVWEGERVLSITTDSGDGCTTA